MAGGWRWLGAKPRWSRWFGHETAYFHGRHILNVHKERDWIAPFLQQINIPTSWIKLVWPARGPNKSSSSQHQSTGDTPGLRWLCLKMYPKAWWLMPWLGYTPFPDTPRCFAQLWIPGQWRKDPNPMSSTGRHLKAAPRMGFEHRSAGVTGGRPSTHLWTSKVKCVYKYLQIRATLRDVSSLLVEKMWQLGWHQQI